MIKIVVFCLITGIIVLYLKNINAEISMLIAIVASCIILGYAVSYLSETVGFFNKIIEASNVSKEFYVIIFKVVAIGYLIEFGAGILNDFGINSLADKLVLFGKIVLLSISMPLFYALFNVISGFLV